LLHLSSIQPSPFLAFMSTTFGGIYSQVGSADDSGSWGVIVGGRE